MKALITGAHGFVGAHLVEHLNACGDEVTAIDRSAGDADILDAEALCATFAKYRPEVIYHLAGDSDVGGSWDHPADTFRANAEGTLNVLAAARSAGVERVLVIGSADVYGRVTPDELPITENHPLRPVSPYAASKVAADYLALQAHLGHSQHVVRTRPFNHLGPGQTTKFVAPALAMRIVTAEATGSSEIPVGNLSSQRDFTDVRDVVRAYRLLVEQGSGGEVYNVCSGSAIAVADLAQQMIALATTPLRLVSDPELQRPVDIPVLCGDNSRLRAATGWSPEIPLADTLADLLSDFRTRRASN